MSTPKAYDQYEKAFYTYDWRSDNCDFVCCHHIVTLLKEDCHMNSEEIIITLNKLKGNESV